MKMFPESPTSQPKTKEELQVLIGAEIKKNGNQCDLNHIDVSLITNFSSLFWWSEFNGNISKWDVSGATNMDSMFANSKFNGDISKWNVSKVEYMCLMFSVSKLNSDISRWDVSGARDMCGMFYGSSFEGDLSSWNRFSIKFDRDMFCQSLMAKKLGILEPSFEQVRSHFVSLKLGTSLQDVSPRQVKQPKVRL